MKMASKHAKDIVSVFLELAKFAQPTSAVFSNQSTADTLILNTKWSQRDLERGEKTSFTKTYVLCDSGSTGLSVVTSTAPQQISNVLWNKESPSGRLRALLLKSKNKKGEEKQYFEIWNTSKKIKTIVLENCEKHGKVYEDDDQFGGLEWSPSEKYLVYIAERKVEKSISFFQQEKKEETEGGQKKEQTTRGEEYEFLEEWGEQLVGKHHPVPCIVDVQSGEITVLDNIPQNVSAGDPRWSADDEGVVFVGWDHEPYRLGIIYCKQRKSAIYFVDRNNSQCSALSEEKRAVHSPRFSMDRSRLYFLDMKASGAHNQCARLVMYDVIKKTTSVIVDTVTSPKADEFQGLYSNLTERGWCRGGAELLLNTYWRSREVPITVNLETKIITKLDTGPHEGSCELMDVWNNYLVVMASAPNEAPYLMVGKLESSGTKWLPLKHEDTRLTGISYTVLQNTVTPDRASKQYPSLDYESILCLPTSQDLPPDYKPPLIVFPHGGPHTTFSTGYMLYTAGFCLCGYAVLLVNYRGSIGFGQDSIESLLGHVGEQDVKDCWAGAMSVIASGKVDPNNMFVFGGSHGGFLTTHLIGQYPGKFQGAACRNPVIDLTTMIGTTDIIDWVFEESGQSFEFSSLVSKELLGEMWRRSPLSFVDQVRTPILLIIGKDDQRVPPSQAKHYYKMLKARNQPVRLLAYEDNCHPIITVPAESDCFVNIMLWFQKHMVSTQQ